MSAGLQAISGNTFPVKDKLKALGATWNGDKKAWMVAGEKAEEARKIVAAAGPARSFAGGGETKNCWECGCRFSYAQARANGGDWGEGYCGC